MRKLSEKIEGGKRYIIHPDFHIGLDMLQEWIDECKEMERKVEELESINIKETRKGVDCVCRELKKDEQRKK